MKNNGNGFNHQQKYEKISKRYFSFFGFTCDIKETNNANVLVTKIDYNANFEKRLTLIETFFYFGNGNGKNKGKFDIGADQVPGGSS